MPIVRQLHQPLASLMVGVSILAGLFPFSTVRWLGITDWHLPIITSHPPTLVQEYDIIVHNNIQFIYLKKRFCKVATNSMLSNGCSFRETMYHRYCGILVVWGLMRNRSRSVRDVKDATYFWPPKTGISSYLIFCNLAVCPVAQDKWRLKNVR